MTETAMRRTSAPRARPPLVHDDQSMVMEPAPDETAQSLAIIGARKRFAQHGHEGRSW